MSDMGLDELAKRLQATHAAYPSADEFLQGCHNWGLDYKESFDALNSYLEYRRKQEIEDAYFDAVLEDFWRTILKQFAPLMEALLPFANWLDRRLGK